MKNIFTALFILISANLFSQSFQSADTISCPLSTENIYVRPLYSDSLCSSFVIFIKKEVKLHKHEHHAEHVYVLQGEADMLLGDKKFHIKKGDVIFIPENTPHKAVTTSTEPLKIISLQSPYFDGKDRVVLE